MCRGLELKRILPPDVFASLKVTQTLDNNRISEMGLCSATLMDECEVEMWERRWNAAAHPVETELELWRCGHRCGRIAVVDREHIIAEQGQQSAVQRPGVHTGSSPKRPCQPHDHPALTENKTSEMKNGSCF